jgi:PIN domain nuclease of toxin-antitoxin system
LWLQLLDNDYREIPITGLHAITVGDLPLSRKDPFDRLLLAQAKTEGLCLLTTDVGMSVYPAQVILVREYGFH